MIKTRKEFPKFLDEMGIEGIGVELGVFKGQFLEHLILNWNGCEIFYGIDNCLFKPNSNPAVNSTISYHEQLEIVEEMSRRIQHLQKLGKDVVTITSDSAEAANNFEDNSVAFCYIDASHDYRSVTKNLEAWWPKIKDGGVIAGHDYFNASYRHNLIEVKRAVNNFFYQIEGKEILTTQERRLPSWYVVNYP